MATATFRVGEWLADPALNRISRGEVRVLLQSHAMDLLVYLAQRPREVVTTDELLTEIWAGRVVTTASVYTCLKQLRDALGDDARNPTFIQTIPKRGFRLIASVECIPAQAPPDQADPPPFKLPGNRLSWAAAALAAIVAVAYLAVSRSPESQTDAPTVTRTPTLAVLPFSDMTPNADHAWFADGMAEEILDQASETTDLKVIGRNSSFAFRTQQADLAEIARQLNASHVLEGRVRKEGNQMQVTARLIRTSDGFEVWSQEYDRRIEDSIEVQDDISRNIASALGAKTQGQDASAKTAAPRRMIPVYSAYELFLQARELMQQGTKTALMSARVKLERALALEPEMVKAHLAMARIYFDLTQYSGYYQENWLEESRDLARPHVEQALALNPESGDAYALLGELLMGQDKESLAAFEKAIELNPNSFRAHLELGVSQLDQMVSWSAPIPYLERALEIEPLSLAAASALVQFLGFIPHRWDEAESIITKHMRQHPDRTDMYQTEAFWQLNIRGHPAAAVSILEEALLADPDLYWARSFLRKAWFCLGETERALQSTDISIHWTYVLAPDREDSLEKLKSTEAWPATDHGRRLLSAYAFVMLRDWQAAIDVLSEDIHDLEQFKIIYIQEMALNPSPAMSLAVAFKKLGDQDRYEQFAALERLAINTRTDNGRFHNIQYARGMARLYALEGRTYESFLELRRLISQGPIDPRELIHPAFDEMRETAEFSELVAMQRERVNSERQTLGLAPIQD